MITLPPIAPLDPHLEQKLHAYIDGLAKPPGSLGRLEEIALRIGLIQNKPNPAIKRPMVFVFAGDHGLTEDGVSRYPASVTGAMVQTFLAGKASANALAKAVGADMRVVDAGVATPVAPHPNLIDAKVRAGTANAAREPAMTAAQADEALKRGIEIARQAVAEGCDAIALGEMGIGNTASAALIMHRLTSTPLPLCVGRGAGHDDAGLARKLAVLERAADRSPVTDPMAVLTEFGGCEIAMMAGAVLGAASARCVVVVDGFISSAAALAAFRLEPRAKDYCLFAHCSAEAGHKRLLEALDARPLLNLDMRLGEGTGALLAMPLIKAAANILTEIATLDDVLNGKL